MYHFIYILRKSSNVYNLSRLKNNTRGIPVFPVTQQVAIDTVVKSIQNNSDLTCNNS